MSTNGRSRNTGLDRRQFLATAASTLAASQLGGIGSASAQSRTDSARAPGARQGAHTSFGSLKQIDAGVLSVGYAEAGLPTWPVVLLLHGWPYDIHSYVDVAPRLASAGYRVIVPHLRGYGTTRFLAGDAVRTASPRPSRPIPSRSRTPTGPQRLASAHQGRRRARPAPGSAPGLCEGGRRRGPLLTATRAPSHAAGRWRIA
jgi:hypothetical protein